MSSSFEPHEPDRLIVEVRWGLQAYHKAIVEPGRTLRVGRAEPAELVLPEDERLEAMHFELAWDGKICRLKDLGSRYGTQLGGEYVKEDSVPHGGWLRAGRTDFSVYFEGATPPLPLKMPESESLLESRRQALEVLREQPGSLFMILDAARDERIRVLLRESVESYRSLYEGPQGDALAEVAPYLVLLPKGSRLLRSLVMEGWGRNWGILGCCDLPLRELCRHFRHFLMVQDPEGRPLYFRFYDPRVLGEFLSICSPIDSLRFFGPVRSLVMEGQTPERIRRFRPHAHGIWQEDWKLEAPPQPPDAPLP